ncbi:hypothetical protein BH09CHL1_BH09CHL1_30740 [soil metagenome]
MLGNLQHRLIDASESTHREQAAILFGTTAVTFGVMAGAIALAASKQSINDLPLQWAALGMVLAAGAVLLRRIQFSSPVESRGRAALAAMPLMALLLGLTLTSGIGANAQDVTFVSGDVVVTTDDLNLRDDASVDATLIDTLPVGTPVTITSDAIVGGEYTWYAVESDYGDGYVVADYLSDPATIPSGTAVSINTDELNLRSAAGTDSEVLSTLDSGTEITVVSEPTVLNGITWYQVDTAAGSGWVAGEFLTVLV